MPNHRRNQRLKVAGIAVAGVLTLGCVGVVAAAALTPRTPPPVSDRVASYLASPPAAFTPAPAVPLPEIEASVKMTGKPNGPIAAMDTSHPITNFGGAPGSVLDGSWQHNVGGFVAPAAYAQVELPGDVTRIGAAARFPSGAEKSGSIALVIPSAGWESGTGWKSGVHFVANGNGEWNVSYYGEGKVGPIYASGTVPNFRDGREVRFDIQVDRASGTATVALPDLSTHKVQSPRITADSSNFAIFELYETSGESTPAVITEMWASSK